MTHRIMWAVAVVLAAMALVAGCINVDAPRGPYVVAGDTSRPPTQAQQQRVGSMDRAALEQEVLRLTAENDSLRQQLDKAKREIKVLKSEKDQLEEQADRLKDDMKEMRKR